MEKRHGKSGIDKLIEKTAPLFWRDKRVLVTGHTGFKGSWLGIWLESMGAVVTGLALPPPASELSLFDAARVGDNIDSHIVDVRNFADVFQHFVVFQPEIVFHLAAQPLVLRSYQEPIETFSTNIMGTVNVLEACRKTPSVSVVVNVTTDKCYDNQEFVWGYRETDKLGGHDPYSGSKACSELISASYRLSFFEESSIALATARAGNVIGGGDWSENRLIPDILRSFDKNEPALIRNPDSIRPWQHVLDPLSGYLLLAERLYGEGRKFAESWNFGPRAGDVSTVGWVADRMVEHWGGNASWHATSDEKLHESSSLKLDISKVREILGWSPMWSIEKAIEHTAAWHFSWRRGLDMRAVCLDQIDAYFKEGKKENE